MKPSSPKMKKRKKERKKARHQRLTPVILATWEAEIRRFHISPANSLRDCLENTQHKKKEHCLASVRP
jgi:hypothetical protein